MRYNDGQTIIGGRSMEETKPKYQSKTLQGIAAGLLVYFGAKYGLAIDTESAYSIVEDVAVAVAAAWAWIGRVKATHRIG